MFGDLERYTAQVSSNQNRNQIGTFELIKCLFEKKRKIKIKNIKNTKIGAKPKELITKPPTNTQINSKTFKGAKIRATSVENSLLSRKLSERRYSAKILLAPIPREIKRIGKIGFDEKKKRKKPIIIRKDS